jgi:hypothetical protein
MAVVLRVLNIFFSNFEDIQRVWAVSKAEKLLKRDLYAKVNKIQGRKEISEEVVPQLKNVV